MEAQRFADKANEELEMCLVSVRRSQKLEEAQRDRVNYLRDVAIKECDAARQSAYRAAEISAFAADTEHQNEIESAVDLAYMFMTSARYHKEEVEIIFRLLERIAYNHT